ncbi:apolipoprotein N-acyltransferase [Loktanella sp. SALINAS62]|uniref:apolipoprotein N-acyltransferase n=1 Tax=Loktanella sp. SALINAS62 TaxID=2706124 RepID=UPI001B8D8631|nr:apolipoprotein N-acyltransferase [Loktanella sp. SALINAS62]MBS1303210.1 apolipoprotein N-acyltransferase [Loktanella sp. SALINAS62]
MTLARVWTASAWLRLAGLLALGVFIALSHAPFDLWPAAMLGWALALAVLTTAPTLRAAMVAMGALGLGYFGFTLRWLVEPFLVDAATWGWAAPLGVSLMALRETLFWVVAVAAARLIGAGRLPALVLCLTLAEALRGYLFTGFPWALIGHALIPMPLSQLAAFGGPHLLTLLLLIISAGLVMLARGRWWGGVPAVLAGLALPLLAPGPADTVDGPLIRIVQPNAPQDEKWDPERNRVFFNRMMDATRADPVPDLIVWPETAIPVRLDYSWPELEAMADAARGAPLITGINRVEDGQYYNSLIVLGRGAQVQDVYDKSHLVPFGEYVPFGDVLKSLGVRGLAPSDGGGFAKGLPRQSLIDLPGIGAARALICYEGIFAEEITVAGARPRLLVMITNDAWFGEAAGPQQHLAQARLRAIEQGLPMVRSANTGISAMIDARGRILASLPLGQAGHIDAALPPALSPTVYTRWGDWPVMLLVLLGLCATWGAKRRGHKVAA